MATKSSYMLAVLLIANPFMLLFFQNCSPTNQARNIASQDQAVEKLQNSEYSVSIDKNLKIK